MSRAKTLIVIVGEYVDSPCLIISTVLKINGSSKPSPSQSSVTGMPSPSASISSSLASPSPSRSVSSETGVLLAVSFIDSSSAVLPTLNAVKNGVPKRKANGNVEIPHLLMN